MNGENNLGEWCADVCLYLLIVSLWLSGIGLAKEKGKLAFTLRFFTIGRKTCFFFLLLLLLLFLLQLFIFVLDESDLKEKAFHGERLLLLFTWSEISYNEIGLIILLVEKDVSIQYLFFTIYFCSWWIWCKGDEDIHFHQEFFFIFVFFFIHLKRCTLIT